MKNLSREINHILVDRKMDKSELAERLGMTRQNLSRILSPNKKRQDLMCSALEKISLILEVNISHFFDDAVSGFGPVSQRSSVPQIMGAIPTEFKGTSKADILEQKLIALNQIVRVADDLLKECETAAQEHNMTTTQA